MLNKPIIEADSLTPDQLGRKLLEERGALVLKDGRLYHANCYGSQIVLGDIRADRNGARRGLHLQTSAEFVKEYNAARQKLTAKSCC